MLLRSTKGGPYYSLINAVLNRSERPSDGAPSMWEISPKLCDKLNELAHLPF
jgi:hypothetical protein